MSHCPGYYWFNLKLCIQISQWIHFIFFCSVLCPRLSLSLFMFPRLSPFEFLYVHHTILVFQPFLLVSFPPFFTSSLSFSFSFFCPKVSFLLSASPSLCFFHTGSKWLSDGCNPILQMQQKWWLGSSCAFVTVSVCVRGFSFLFVFPWTHCVCRFPPRAVLLSFFSFSPPFSHSVSLTRDIWQGA